MKADRQSMRALVYDGALRYKQEVPVPIPDEKEALIRVTHAGICSTDLELLKGYMAFRGIPGHEFVGIVEECGQEDLRGKRVVGEINVNCGTCDLCIKGLKNHCAKRSVLGILNRVGVFCDYTCLPLRNLHVIPDGLSDIEGVFVEPVAAAFEILEQVSIGEGDRVCVLGDGKLGLLVAQVLAGTGCGLLVLGHHPEKLAILKEMSIPAERKRNFRGDTFDVVVECTGSSSGMESAMDLVRPGGKIVMKTTVAKESSFAMNRLVVNEIQLIGSRCGPFPPAIQALAEGTVHVNPLVSASFPLKDGARAFSVARKRGVLKVILQIA